MTRFQQFLYNYRNAILTWAVMVALIFLGIILHIDKALIGIVVLLVGLLGYAFAALVAWIAFIPLIGPLVAKLLALPFFWLLNGIGYLASIIAIKRGYSRDIVNYRVLTVVLLIGVTIGYILGKLI